LLNREFVAGYFTLASTRPTVVLVFLCVLHIKCMKRTLKREGMF